MTRAAITLLAALLTACGGGEPDDETERVGPVRPAVCTTNPGACL